jgi:hypothetical protein
VSQFGVLKLAETSSLSESNEEEVYLGDSDKDVDVEKVTDADIEYLYYEGVFSNGYESHDWMICIICKKWIHTRIHSKT